MKKEPKIVTFFSPVPQSGQTTLANLIGLDLARRGKFVLILEMARTTGFSIYLNKNLGEYKRDLKTCLVNPATFKENIIKSPHSNRLFYVSQNAFSSISDLVSYNPVNIDAIVGQAKELFEYIFIDLPSNTEDVATVQVLGRNFTHKINHSMVSITENVLAIKRLNEFDALIAKSTLDGEKQDTTIVVNKSMNRYTTFFEPYLKNLPKSNVVNLVNVINVAEMPYLGNEGNILEMGQHTEAKEYFKGISILADILDEDLKGFGLTKAKESKTSKKLRGSKLTSGTDKKVKKETKKAKKEPKKAKKEKVEKVAKKKPEKKERKKSKPPKKGEPKVNKREQEYDEED